MLDSLLEKHLLLCEGHQVRYFLTILLPVRIRILILLLILRLHHLLNPQLLPLVKLFELVGLLSLRERKAKRLRVPVRRGRVRLGR